jgi:hypothetical protein
MGIRSAILYNLCQDKNRATAAAWVKAMPCSDRRSKKSSYPTYAAKFPIKEYIIYIVKNPVLCLWFRDQTLQKVQSRKLCGRRRRRRRSLLLKYSIWIPFGCPNNGFLQPTIMTYRPRGGLFVSAFVILGSHRKKKNKNKKLQDLS